MACESRGLARLADVGDETRLTDLTALRSVYSEPSQVVIDKAINHVCGQHPGPARTLLSSAPTAAS